jgi:hypothetical protein
MRRMALATGQATAAALALAAPSLRERLGWQELANKLEAYSLFRHAAGALGPGSRRLPLAAQVARAQALGPYRALWVIEGLGFRHAEMGWRSGAEPRELLGGDGAADVPAGSLVALHCGMALSLASRLLGRIAVSEVWEPWEAWEASKAWAASAVSEASAASAAAAGELRRALAEFIAASREISRPGYAGAMLEGLGFAARLLRPRWVPAIARELPGLAAEVDACFWHGVGRALYFLPANLSPRRSAPWRAAAMALSEPVQAAGPPGSPGPQAAENRAAEATIGRACNNALAGLAWPLVLINLRHPQVLSSFLRRHAPLAEDAAFVSGIGSALRVWCDCMPGDPYVAALRGYRPQPPEAGLARLWQRSIAAECAAAMEEDYPRLREQGRLGELFHFRPAAAAAGGGRDGASGRAAGAPECEMPGQRRDRC